MPHLSHQANFHCLEQGWKATKGKMHQTTQQWIPETNGEKKTIIFESLVFVFFRSAIFSFLPEDLLDWKWFKFLGVGMGSGSFWGIPFSRIYSPAIERGSFFLKFLKLTTIFGNILGCLDKPRNAKDLHRHPCCFRLVDVTTPLDITTPWGVKPMVLVRRYLDTCQAQTFWGGFKFSVENTKTKGKNKQLLLRKNPVNTSHSLSLVDWAVDIPIWAAVTASDLTFTQLTNP